MIFVYFWPWFDGLPIDHANWWNSNFSIMTLQVDLPVPNSTKIIFSIYFEVIQLMSEISRTQKIRPLPFLLSFFQILSNQLKIWPELFLDLPVQNYITMLHGCAIFLSNMEMAKNDNFPNFLDFLHQTFLFSCAKILETMLIFI